jgi:hypothetical protein
MTGICGTCAVRNRTRLIGTLLSIFKWRKEERGRRKEEGGKSEERD